MRIIVDNKNTTYGDDAPAFTLSYDPLYGFKYTDNWGVLTGENVFSCDYEAGDNVGDYEISASGYDADNGNYNVVYSQTGTLTVNKRVIGLHSDGASKLYDGTPLSNENVEITNSGRQLLDGHKLVVVSYPSIIHVSESKQNAMELKVTSEDGLIDYTNNYDLTSLYVKERIEITQRHITVTSASDNKIYDGTALTNHNYEVSWSEGYEQEDVDPIADTDEVSVTITGSKTKVTYVEEEVADVPNTILNVSITNKQTHDSVNGDYVVTRVEGRLRIDPCDITIQIGDIAKTYDGLPVIASEANVEVEDLPDGYRAEYSNWPTTYIDAGRYEIHPTITIYDSLDNVVDMENFSSASIRYGYITISPIVIKLYSDSKVKEYDGTPLYGDDYGHVFEWEQVINGMHYYLEDATVTGVNNDFGSVNNTITYGRIVDEFGNDALKQDSSIAYTNAYRDNIVNGYNFVIRRYEGTLTIKNTFLRLYDFSKRYNDVNYDVIPWKVYDGEPFSVDDLNDFYNRQEANATNYYNYYYVIDGIDGYPWPSGCTIQVVLKDGVELESLPREEDYILNQADFDIYLLDEHGERLTTTVICESIRYHIYDENQIKIIGRHDYYEYDAQVHKTPNDKFLCIGDLHDGDRVEINYLNELTDIDDIDNDFNYLIYNQNDQDVTTTYDIDVESQGLSVYKRDVHIYCDEIITEYTGTKVLPTSECIRESNENYHLLPNHELRSVLFDDENYVNCKYDEHDELSYYYSRITNVLIVDELGNDVTDLYQVSDWGNNNHNKCPIKITPREVSFSSDSVDKLYDGDPLVGQISQVHYIDGLLGDDDYVVSIDPEQTITNIGVIDNTFIITIYSSEHVDISRNYKVVWNSAGTLTVNGILDFEIDAVNNEKIYDRERIDGSVTLGDSLLMDGYYYLVELYSDVEDFIRVRRNNNGDVIPYNDYVTRIVVTNDSDNLSSYVIEYTYSTDHEGNYYVSKTVEYSLLDENHRLVKTYDANGNMTNRQVALYSAGTFLNNILGYKMNDFGYIIDTNQLFGELTINPRPIYVYSDNVELIYDGKVHTYPNLKVTVDLENEKYDLLEGRSAVIKNPVEFREVKLDINGDATFAYNSSLLNNIRVMDGMSDVTSDYVVMEYTAGKVTVNKRVLHVTTGNFSKRYDGVDFFKSNSIEWSYEESELASTDYIDEKSVLFGSIFTSVGTYPLEVRFDIINSESENVVTNCYDIQMECGELEITDIPYVLIVFYDYQYKTYDGLPFDFDENKYQYRYYIDSVPSDLPDGYSVILELNDIEFESAVGVYTINPTDYTAYVLNDLGERDEAYTSIISKAASLYEILSDDIITVMPANVSVPYDGLFHNIDPEDFEYTGTLHDGHEIRIESISPIAGYKNIGENYTPNYTVKIYDSEGNDVTGLYQVRKHEDFGKVSITKRILQITFDDIHHEYDGNAVSLGIENVNTVYGLLDGHTLRVVTSEESFTEIMYDGEGNVTYGIANVSYFEVRDTKNNNVSQYYDCKPYALFDFNKCRIYIEPKSITIKPKDVTVPYDGKAHKATEWEIIKGALPAGYSIEASYIGSITNPGQVTSRINTETFVITDNEGNNVNESFEIIYKTGTITVTNPDITVSASYNGVYDGNSHSGEFVIISGLAYLEGFRCDDIEIYGSRTDVGMTETGVTSLHIYNDQDVDVTELFNITKEAGEINITPYAVTIKPEDREKEVDGTPLTCNIVEYVTPMLSGYYIEIETNGSITNPGTVDNEITNYVIYDSHGNVVDNKNFDVTCEVGTLTINKHMITLAPLSGYSRNYSGKVISATQRIIYSNCDMEVTVTGTVLGSQTNVGEVITSIEQESVVIKDSHGNIITSQFEIEYLTGSFTINPRSITVKPEDVIVSYDGNEHAPNGYMITSGTKLVKGHTAHAEYDGSLVERDEISSSITMFVIFDEHGVDVTSNYNVVKTTGIIRVN